MADQALVLSPIRQLVEEGSPIQRLLGETLKELGGIDFLVDWAEDYPEQFMRILMAANPTAVLQGPNSSGPTINLNLPPGCGPGPLDVVADQ